MCLVFYSLEAHLHLLHPVTRSMTTDGYRRRRQCCTVVAYDGDHESQDKYVFEYYIGSFLCERSRRTPCHWSALFRAQNQ